MSKNSTPPEKAAIFCSALIWLMAVEYSLRDMGGSPTQITGLRAARSWLKNVLSRAW